VPPSISGAEKKEDWRGRDLSKTRLSGQVSQTGGLQSDAVRRMEHSQIWAVGQFRTGL